MKMAQQALSQTAWSRVCTLKGDLPKRSARVEGGYADHRKRPSTASRAASAVSAVALVQVSPVLAIFPA